MAPAASEREQKVAKAHQQDQLEIDLSFPQRGEHDACEQDGTRAYDRKRAHSRQVVRVHRSVVGSNVIVRHRMLQPN